MKEGRKALLYGLSAIMLGAAMVLQFQRGLFWLGVVALIGCVTVAQICIIKALRAESEPFQGSGRKATLWQSLKRTPTALILIFSLLFLALAIGWMVIVSGPAIGWVVLAILTFAFSVQSALCVSGTIYSEPIG